MASAQGDVDTPQNRKPGRPRSDVSGQEVTELREQGLSWRQVASRIGVSPATCMRAARAFQNHENACQNLAVPDLDDCPQLWDD